MCFVFASSTHDISSAISKQQGWMLCALGGLCFQFSCWNVPKTHRFACVRLLGSTGDAFLLEGYPGQHGPPGGQVQNYASSECVCVSSFQACLVLSSQLAFSGWRAMRLGIRYSRGDIWSSFRSWLMCWLLPAAHACCCCCRACCLFRLPSLLRSTCMSSARRLYKPSSR